MGCTASRLDNEDTVRHCKERCRLMKDAVYARHHLASAHHDYLQSLCLTGSALTRFAAGEPLSVSDHTPPVLLSTTSSSGDAASSFPPPTPATTTTTNNTKPPQPKPSRPTMNSTYATTPSQASSFWDWENFYPPSPPGSDFFDRHQQQQNHHHHQFREEDEDEDEDAGEGRREEIHCSKWCDEHYSTTTTTTGSSTTKQEEDEREADSRSESAATRSDFGGSSYSVDAPGRRPPSEKVERSEAGSSSRWSSRKDAAAASASARELKMVVRHNNLSEIVAALEEYFVKAAAAGEVVSELLETGRAQFESSFRQLKKTVYHSTSLLSSLSSRWTSKPPLAIRYRLDTGVIAESGGAKSHGSTLERLLAWERKLYDEVKAREGAKIEHEKKLKALQKLEYKGRDGSKMDKTKASIKKLQSLIIVTSEAVCTTSSAILRVRDSEIAEQLVAICYGHLKMWRSMNQFHEFQNQIVQQVHGLINHYTASETSELHRLATRDLEAAVMSWHSSFNCLVKYQRDYIRALYSWLKLTHLPVSSDSQKDNSTAVSVELTTFCDEWKQALDRLPDTVASEAIKSFVNVIHVISTKQSEELKMKIKAGACSKQLERKSSALRAIEKKYYTSYSVVGLGIPEDGHNGNGQVLDTRDPLAEKKLEIARYRRKMEEELLWHAKAVQVTRSMTLNNIQTGLPGVFQAMTAFSGLFAEALQAVCTKAGS